MSTGANFLLLSYFVAFTRAASTSDIQSTLAKLETTVSDLQWELHTLATEVRQKEDNVYIAISRDTFNVLIDELHEVKVQYREFQDCRLKVDADISKVKNEFQEYRIKMDTDTSKVKNEVQEYRIKMDTDISKVKNECQTELQKVSFEIAEMKSTNQSTINQQQKEMSILILPNDNLKNSTNEVKASCSGENWVPYKDEKCVKIIDQVVNRDAAVELCLRETGEENGIQPLLSIKTLEEQTFLTNFIFNQSGVIDNVWLGADRFNVTHFQWNDGASMEYSNWEQGGPSNDPEKSCVQMLSHLSKKSSKAEDGQWNDATCLRRNLIVCQKLQTLPLAEIQKIVLANRKKLEDMESNPVPVGFIYVELPGQPDPQQLWPNVIWQDATSQYAGLFFRAAGGSAAAFNVTQSYNAPRLTNVQYYDYPDRNIAISATVAADGQYSRPVHSGYYARKHDDTYDLVALKFLVSSGEVRPTNTAIRIWKRVE